MNKIKLSILLLFFVTFSIFSQEKKYNTYKAEKGETIQTISRKFTITPFTLLQLNPDIKDGIVEGQLIIVPNKNYKPALDKEIKGDYIKDGFLYHKVIPKENYYRLKKQFGVAKRILRKYNPSLRTGNPRAGEVIKIPVKKGYQSESTRIEVVTTKPYLVRPKETKHSISRRFGISIEKLEELNPQIKDGLKMATIIKVPNTEAIPDTNEGYVLHKVEKGETFFSLGQLFKLSQEQLITFNPELNDGVKEGMLIKIPKNTSEENSSVFVANITSNTELKIAMMLPFMSGNEINFNNNAKDKSVRRAARTLNRVTDFYLGALMALDSVKKQGVSVSVKVFDTQNRTSTISTILRTNDFSDVDAIVGPMFLNNVKFVSQSLRLDSVAIISPASSKDHMVFASKNMVKEMPSDELLTNKVLDYIKKKYNGQRIIVIADDKKENVLKVNKIVAKLNELDSLQKVMVLKPEEGYIKPDFFREAILEDKENWIVLITEDNVVTADVINNLGVLPEEVKATLFAFHRKSNFDKVDNNFLARINFHYPTSSFVDYENEKTKMFIQKYKAINHAEPTEYAFKGFDITYDALVRLASHSNIENAFNSGVSERTSCIFQYTKNPKKGFENKGIYLIKYDGLNLAKVED